MDKNFSGCEKCGGGKVLFCIHCGKEAICPSVIISPAACKPGAVAEFVCLYCLDYWHPIARIKND